MHEKPGAIAATDRSVLLRPTIAGCPHLTAPGAPGPCSPAARMYLDTLRDIVLDVGARPRAFFGRQKLVYLDEDPEVVVTDADLQSIEVSPPP